MLAAAGYAFIAICAGGAIQLARWVLPLEARSSSAQLALEATHEILNLHQAFWVSAVISILAVCFSAVWLARHITGPLTRFAAAFAEVGSGRTPPPLAIRATDYLAAEVEAFNAMLASVGERSRAQATLRDELAAQLDELTQLASERGDAALLERAQRSSELAKGLAAGGSRELG